MSRGAKTLLRHQDQSIVLARPSGKIHAWHRRGDGGHRTASLVSSLPSDKQEANLPSVLRSAIERETRHMVIEDLQVHFSQLPIIGITTAAELISIQFSAAH